MDPTPPRAAQTPPTLPPKELRTSYAAFNARDVAVALRVLAPDVEWPDQLAGAILRGPEAVGEYWRRQWAVLDPHFEMKHFELDANGYKLVTLVQTVRGLNGSAISQGLVRHIYAFENGLVRRMWALL
ncbi:MAG: nuclear transport factor 2 family protein [Flavobacteriales bacterium]|nr:MAG: nuclear transport factor 2 family protein [Flavobacteriales bacterium]